MGYKILRYNIYVKDLHNNLYYRNKNNKFYFKSPSFNTIKVRMQPNITWKENILHI